MTVYELWEKACDIAIEHQPETEREKVIMRCFIDLIRDYKDEELEKSIFAELTTRRI